MTPQSEREFQTDVLRLADMFKWRVYHTHDSRRSTPGFPDLVMVRAPRLIVAELKTQHGRTSPDQDAWLDELERVPRVEVYLWRPADLQFIAETLA